MRDINLNTNEVFKAVIVRSDGVVHEEFGPYGTIGAAKGRVTSYVRSANRYAKNPYGGYVASIKGEWQKVEGTDK